jgi:hypothetical protein
VQPERPLTYSLADLLRTRRARHRNLAFSAKGWRKPLPCPCIIPGVVAGFAGVVLLDLYEHRGKEFLLGNGLETLRDWLNVSRIAFALRAVQR